MKTSMSPKALSFISIIAVLLWIIPLSACGEPTQSPSASPTASQNLHVRDLDDADLLALIANIEQRPGGVLADLSDSIKCRIVDRTQTQSELSVKVSYYCEPVESFTGDPEMDGICQLIILKKYSFTADGTDELLSTDEPMPFSNEDAQYLGISIGDSINYLVEVLGEPEEIIPHTNNDPVPPQGAEFVEYRYKGFCYRTLYEPVMNRDALIGQIEIWDTADATGPRGIRIGDSFESVLRCFPQEYDYASDTYHRIYGMRTDLGAGGMVLENSLIVTADPFNVEPFMRIDFTEGRVNNITIGNRWI